MKPYELSRDESLSLYMTIRKWKEAQKFCFNVKATLTDEMLLNWKRCRGMLSCEQTDSPKKAAAFILAARNLLAEHNL